MNSKKLLCCSLDWLVTLAAWLPVTTVQQPRNAMLIRKHIASCHQPKTCVFSQVSKSTDSGHQIVASKPQYQRYKSHILKSSIVWFRQTLLCRFTVFWYSTEYLFPHLKQQQLSRWYWQKIPFAKNIAIEDGFLLAYEKLSKARISLSYAH